MNIKRALSRAEFRKDLEDRFKKAYSVIKTLMCQHKECASEIISVELGNSKDSIISEILGEEAAEHSHQLKIRRVYCVNCGRELYCETLSMDEQDNSKDKNDP